MCSVGGYFKSMINRFPRAVDSPFEEQVSSRPGITPFTAGAFKQIVYHLANVQKLKAVNVPVEEAIHVGILL